MEDKAPFDVTLFTEVETVRELQTLLMKARSNPRKMDFVLFMAAEGRAKRSLIAEFGAAGPAEFGTFRSKYPAVFQYAEDANLIVDAHFACACVRALRNAQK